MLIGIDRYIGIGQYIGLANMEKALSLSVSVSADNLVHIGSFTDIEFGIEKRFLQRGRCFKS